MDQATLAERVGASEATISRVFSGAREPKIWLARAMAEALGVTLDYLLDDSEAAGPGDRLVMVSEDEWTILKVVRRMGIDEAMDRLLRVPH